MISTPTMASRMSCLWTPHSWPAVSTQRGGTTKVDVGICFDYGSDTSILFALELILSLAFILRKLPSVVNKHNKWTTDSNLSGLLVFHFVFLFSTITSNSGISPQPNAVGHRVRVARPMGQPSALLWYANVEGLANPFDLTASREDGEQEHASIGIEIVVFSFLLFILFIFFFFVLFSTSSDGRDCPCCRQE